MSKNFVFTPRKWGVLFCLLLTGSPQSVLAEPAPAASELDAAQCVGFHTDGQKQSKAGDLKSALASFTSCASEECPGVVSSECHELRESVEKRMPTVVFSVTSAEGDDLSHYQVWLDGEVFLEQIDGRARPMNPGTRKVTFVSEEGEHYELDILFREGEKGRRVNYQLEPPELDLDQTQDTAPKKEPGFAVHPLTWAGGGVALLGAGAFTGLALAGKSKEKSLKEECSPSCTDDQVAPAKTMYLAADIALGVGVAGLATAVVGLVLSGRKKETPTADRVAVMVLPGQTFLSYQGQF